MRYCCSTSCGRYAVGVARKSTKKIAISFDEWNVWYHQEEDPIKASGGRWDKAPRLEEDVYTVADAVVVGNLLISLLRNTDRVQSASQAAGSSARSWRDRWCASHRASG